MTRIKNVTSLSGMRAVCYKPLRRKWKLFSRVWLAAAALGRERRRFSLTNFLCRFWRFFKLDLCWGLQDVTRECLVSSNALYAEMPTPRLVAFKFCNFQVVTDTFRNNCFAKYA
jgi:hypothetical protein